ncbi:hypothetical protein RRG08_047876 [Elysia crispata]|uniref:Uncharacterized protein n=1 Tax=Elysia crispata TaxID=231223 RepID=A0AAE0ZLE0_9GAST|nr:hypothetical protein RRG08_047876 [Elysia crispata]
MIKLEIPRMGNGYCPTEAEQAAHLYCRQTTNGVPKYYSEESLNLYKIRIATENRTKVRAIGNENSLHVDCSHLTAIFTRSALLELICISTLMTMSRQELTKNVIGSGQLDFPMLAPPCQINLLITLSFLANTRRFRYGKVLSLGL